jgi:sensor histidine kinase YesM
VLSTIIAYVYFSEVVKKQVIDDEAVKLRQMVYQLEFMVSDIESFSKSIAIDAMVQDIVTQQDYENEFQKVKGRYAVASQLVFYKSLRNYIGAMVIKGTDGKSYGSLAYGDERYYEDKFKILALKEYVENEKLIFSKPYFAFEKDVSQDVISYRTTIRKMTDADQIIGTLYMDIQLEYFLRQIRSYAENYTNVFLVGDDGNPVYIKNENMAEYERTSILNKLQSVGVTSISGGLVLSEPISNMGWTVGIYVSNAYIWEKSNFVLKFFVAFFLISLTLLILITSKILDNMIHPISQLTNAMDTIQYENLEVDLDIHTNDEIERLYRRFKEMLVQINLYMEKVVDHEKQQKEMEFDILLSQINPHYLYNVLNTVVYLSSAGRNKEVVEVVHAMIFTLQETLKVGEMHIFTTLEQELKLLGSYMKIQEYRYPNTFSIRVECEEALRQSIVPKTILQPIVENSLFHGIIPAERHGEVLVKVDVIEDMMIITIVDDGIGVDLAKAKSLLANDVVKKTQEDPENNSSRKHIGIRNIHARIQRLYGMTYGLDIKNGINGGTEVILRFPFA